MSIGEAIENGFSQSVKLLRVALIFFVLNVIMGLISLPMAGTENAQKPGVAALSFALSVVFFVIFIFLQGGTLGLARDILKRGSHNMSNFVMYGKKYYMRILGLLLIYILIAIAVVLLLALAGSGILAIANNNFTKAIVGTIVLIVAVMAIVLLLYPIYSIVADENSVIQALKKGVRTSWNSFWRTLLLFVLLLVISIFISLVVGFIIGLITVPLPFKVTQVIITIVNSAIQAYIPIVMMLALMGFYLRLTTEAEDLQSSSA